MARSSKRICGLDLRRDQVCIVQYSPERDSVDSVAIKPVPEISGNFWDVLLHDLPEWVAETKLKGQNAVCALPAEKAVIKRLIIDSDENDIPAALEWELSQHLVESIDKYAFDFQSLSAPPGGGVRQYLSVACRREDLQSIAGVARASKLNPVIMDVDIFALINLFEHNYRERLDEFSMLIHGDDSVLASVLTRHGEFIDLETEATPHGDAQQVARALKRMQSSLCSASPGLDDQGAIPTYYAGPLFADPEIVEVVQGVLGNTEVLYPFRKISCHAPGMGEDDLMRYAPHLATAVGLALRGSIG